MLNGSDAAETVVRMMLNGSEVMLRLTGSATKNALAFLMAAAKSHRKVHGKTALVKLMREPSALRTFSMTNVQYVDFKKYAKKYRILYSAVKEKANKESIDVILPESALERANHAFEKMCYVPKQQAKEQSEKKDSRSERDSSGTKNRSKTQEKTNNRPSVEKQLENYKAKCAPTKTATKTKSKGR